jgi:transposase
MAAIPLAAIFGVMKTRGAQGVRSLVGDTFNSIVGSNCWSADNWLEPKHRQLCWAHLFRDFQKFVERGNESACPERLPFQFGNCSGIEIC